METELANREFINPLRENHPIGLRDLSEAYRFLYLSLKNEKNKEIMSNEMDTKFVYVKPPVKHMILKASLLLMIMANVALFFAVYEMALTMPMSSANYLTFGIIILTANACAAISVLNDQWKFLLPLFVVLIPCAFVPVFFFLYSSTIPLFCRLNHFFNKNDTVEEEILKSQKIHVCVLHFPGTQWTQTYMFLYFGLEKLLELYLVTKLIRLMQKDSLEFLRSRDEENQRRAVHHDEDSEDDMVVYEKVPKSSSSKSQPTDVVDRHAPIQ